MIEKNNRGAKRIYVTIPERIFDDIREMGLLKDMDAWITNAMIEEIENKKEELKENGRR